MSTSGGAPRVGHVVQSLEIGGLERVVATLAGRSGARYTGPVYCLDRDGFLAGALRERGVAVHTVARSPRGFDPAALWRLAGRMRRDRLDIVHCHNYAALVYGALAALVAGNLPVVYTIHGAKTSRRRATRVFQRLRLADVVVFVSEDSRRVAIGAGAVDAARSRTIVNGTDVESFAPLPGGRQKARRPWGIADDAPVAGIVARLTRAKDHRTLFEAVAMLRGDWPGLRCLVVGDGELRSELTDAASALGIADAVIFAGARSDVREVLSAMDIFVLSSSTEGLPVTVLEAMCAALPVVATRVGGIPEVVEDARTGLLVPPRDPPALKAAIESLLRDRARARAMGDAGRERVLDRFSVGAMARRYEALYDEVRGLGPRSGDDRPGGA